MYQKCIDCPHLGKKCGGPHFFVMSPEELSRWCRDRKNYLHLTNQKLEDISGIPKGTIDRILSGNHTSFRYDTMLPLIRALVGGDPSKNICFKDADSGKELQKLQQENERLRAELANFKKSKGEKIDRMEDELREQRDTIRHNRYAITTMAVVLAAILSLVLFSVIYIMGINA